MVNYNNGKIYKIESHLGDKIYIGSTTKEYLSQRMTMHRRAYNQWKKGKVNTVKSYELFDEYGIENCEIVLLELCPCNSKDELGSKEAHYIRTLKCVNKYIPGRTDKQYYQDNKIIIKEKTKAYRNEHKDKTKEYNKQYNEDNKAKLKEQMKKYREVNNVPIVCECGCNILSYSKLRHQNSKKHTDLMKLKDN